LPESTLILVLLRRLVLLPGNGATLGPCAEYIEVGRGGSSQSRVFDGSLRLAVENQHILGIEFGLNLMSMDED